MIIAYHIALPIASECQIPLRFASGIIPYSQRLLDSSTNSSNFVPTCRALFSESLTTTCASSFILFALPRHYVPGIVRLTLQASFARFQLGSLSARVIKFIKKLLRLPQRVTIIKQLIAFVSDMCQKIIIG